MGFINIGQKEINININGKSIEEYSILMGVPSFSLGPFGVPPYVMKAQRELRKYIAMISGVTLPLINDKNPIVKDCEIIFGDTDRENNINKEYQVEEYRIKIVKNRVFINGGKRGIIYAVYDFLDKYCGVRFLSSTIEKIKDQNEINIGELDISYLPPIEYREISFWDTFNEDFALKSKVNGNFIRHLTEEYGGGIGWAGGNNGLVHTFSFLVPYDTYFKDHPEMYALNENGKRDPTGLCLSNEDTYQAILKTAKEWLRKAESEDILSVSINDGNVAFCNCPKCAKVREEEGDEVGIIIRTLNRLSDDLKDEFPNVKVETIIYNKMKHAPKITKPRDNVIIQISGTCVRFYSYDEIMKGDNPKLAAIDFDLIKCKINEWKNYSKKLYLWDYPAPYQYINAPFPQFHTLLKNAKFFVKNNIKGLYLNGNTETAAFDALSNYLLMKVMYEPSMSEEQYKQYFDEFLEAYYGDGAPYIKQFIDYTTKLALDNVVTDGFYCEPYDVLGPYPNQEVFDKMKNLFDLAYENAKTPAEKRRVKLDSLQSDYYRLCLSENTEKENKALYEDFKKFGIARIKHNATFPIVHDFNQPPYLWQYWDKQCTTGNRNTERIPEDLYNIVPVDYNVGDIVNVTFDFTTNNSSPDLKFGLFNGNGFSLIKEKEELIWKNYKKYKTVHIDNVRITKLEEVASYDKKAINDKNYEYILPHEVGLIFKAFKMEAGSYFFIRNIKIEKVNK